MDKYPIKVSILAIWAVRATQQERLARESSETILEFMVELFEITDPFAAESPEEKRGETITAREILDRGAERVDTELAEVVGSWRASGQHTEMRLLSRQVLMDWAVPVISDAIDDFDRQGELAKVLRPTRLGAQEMAPR